MEELIDNEDVVEINEEEAIDSIREKILSFYNISSTALFEREELVRLIVLAVFAKDHIFLYGPPGSAKSVAAQALRLLTKGRKFFRYLMTDYTKYDEIFGKEIAKNGEISKRIIEGKLPTAEYGFLDEIFKANAEILNSLLTILNERQFDDDYNGTIDVPIYTVIAASNEFPRTTYLKALFERFPLRIPVPNIKEKKNRIKLMNGEISELKDVSEFSKAEIDYVQKNYRKVKFSEENGELLNSLIDTLHVLMNPDNKEGSVESTYEISGRTTVKMGSILRLSAFLNKRSSTDVSDLMLLRYMAWSNIFERSRVLPKINQVLFGSESEIHGDVIRELDIISIPTMRYLRSIRPSLRGSVMIVSDREFNEMRNLLEVFLNENKDIANNLIKIKAQIEECEKKEQLIRNNIFLHANDVLEWTVQNSFVTVNSEKFNELIRMLNDYDSIQVSDNERVKFRLKELVSITINVNKSIRAEILEWLDLNDSFLSYRISAR